MNPANMREGVRRGYLSPRILLGSIGFYLNIYFHKEVSSLKTEKINKLVSDKRFQENLLINPWHLAWEVGPEILELYPELKRFRHGRTLVRFLSKYWDLKYGDPTNSEKFRGAISCLKTTVQEELTYAFRNYRKELLRIKYDKTGLERKTDAKNANSVLPAPIGLEIEVDNLSRLEITTYPTRSKESIKSFLKSMQKVLFIMEDNDLIPIGYEMGMHVNFGIFRFPTKEPIKSILSRLLKPTRKGLWVWKFFRIGNKCSVLSNSAEHIALYLMLPNIDQARLEYIMNGKIMRLKTEKDRGLKGGYKARWSIEIAEVSTTFDINYFMFTCEFVGRMINMDLAKESDFYILALKYLYLSHGLKINTMWEKDPWAFMTNSLLAYSYGKYNELMDSLRKQIISDLT